MGQMTFLVKVNPKNPHVIELDDWKIYRKALYLMVKTMPQETCGRFWEPSRVTKNGSLRGERPREERHPAFGDHRGGAGPLRGASDQPWLFELWSH